MIDVSNKFHNLLIIIIHILTQQYLKDFSVTDTTNTETETQKKKGGSTNMMNETLKAS